MLSALFRAKFSLIGVKRATLPILREHYQIVLSMLFQHAKSKCGALIVALRVCRGDGCAFQERSGTVQANSYTVREPAVPSCTMQTWCRCKFATMQEHCPRKRGRCLVGSGKVVPIRKLNSRREGRADKRWSCRLMLFGGSSALKGGRHTARISNNIVTRRLNMVALWAPLQWCYCSLTRFQI